VADIDCQEQEVPEFERRERVRGAEKVDLAARPERRTAMTTALTPRLSGRGEGPKWPKPFEAATLDCWSGEPAEDTDPA
jgi:hypothetical protein